MLHTNIFEIAIPKEFLLDGMFKVKTDFYDFKFKVTVYYQCEVNGDKMEIYRQSSSFTSTKYIDWKNSKLEDYFLEAAKNNWESTQGTPEPNSHVHPIFKGILNSIGNYQNNVK